MSAWINHVKKYSRDNNVTYSEALKLAKKTYKKNTKSKKPIRGKGLIDDIRKKINRKLDSRPRIVDSIIKRKGNKKIVELSVCRKPVTTIMQKALNLFTRGKWEAVKAKYNYDDIFHLYLIMKLEDGSVYSIEKNQRVKITKGAIKGGECRKVKTNINLEQFIINGESSGSNFYRYNAEQYNCQNFINTILRLNNINGLSGFIMQNTQELLTPFVKKLSQAASDAAGVVDIALNGGQK